jgi:hypothetical protein
MSKGRNDFQRLSSLAGLLLRWQETHGAHVVQPVGHLDDQHPRVARHRDDHLADGLALGGAAQHHLVQLGHPVDQLADLVAEVGGQRLQRVAGVLDGVVQQGGHQGGGIHAQFGQDVGDRQRMGDVGVTGAPQLVGVLGLGDVVGALQDRQVGLRVDLAVHRHQGLEHRVERAALRGHAAGQPGAYPPRCAAGGLRGVRARFGGRDLGDRHGLDRRAPARFVRHGHLLGLAL